MATEASEAKEPPGAPPQGSSRQGAGSERRSADKAPSPDRPWVAGIAGGATAVGLLFTVGLGLTTVSLVVGVLVAFGTLVMLGFRLRDLRSIWDPRWADRRPSAGGVTMTAVAIVVLLAGAVPALEPTVAEWLRSHLVGHHDGRLWPFRGLALSSTAIAAGVHLSAMVDWALIRPRLLGALSLWNMPCQARRDEHSSNWALWTRVWLGHRFMAYIIVRVGLAVCIGFGAAAIVHPDALSTQRAPQSPASTTKPSSTSTQPSRSRTQPQSPPRQQPPAAQATDEAKKDWVGPVATILGAVAGAILVFFINRLLPVWSLLANPRVDVGDHVVLAEEFGTGVDERPEYYVVDIAIEGVKLLLLDHRGRPTGTVVDRRDRLGMRVVVRVRRSHDRSLDLADVPRLLRARSRFTGCDRRCSGAYHDCPVATGSPLDGVEKPPPKSAQADAPKRWAFWRWGSDGA